MPRHDDNLQQLIASHLATRAPRLQRLWRYYRNPQRTHDARTRLAQEEGLPPRITGATPGGKRREIVIENDIAWRIHAMVDFMFGKPVQIISTADDPTLRRNIERTLDAAWEASGGIALLQDMALLGHVYGYVDLLLRIDEARIGEPDALRVEVVEPTRGIPVLNPDDYRTLDAFIIHADRSAPEPDSHGSLLRSLINRNPFRSQDSITEVLTPGLSRRFRNGRLVHEDEFPLTEIPVVHVQNLSQPLRYEGLSEVEPLIPLQDELNTRLSDRANRITLQCFKMYLAKGIEGFEKFPVSPGQIWSTDNPDAEVIAFGGDAASPSEDAHIEQIREAMDKISGVPPLASGVVRAKLGNLSSANALRVTLMGVLSRTARKRVTYGSGITRICRLMLAALDATGTLRTSIADRGVRLVWPDPLPEDLSESVAAARAKRELGVPEERVLAELGYAPSDPGIT